jgi:CheY-like chemotaxis protein
MRVLVVDDEAAVRVVLRIKLETMGWVVDEAGSADDALARCRQSSPDAVVLDQRMSALTGLEVAKLLRGEGYNGRILLYSAYLTPALESEARTVGIVAVAKTEVSELVDLLKGTVEPGEAGAP